MKTDPRYLVNFYQTIPKVCSWKMVVRHFLSWDVYSCIMFQRAERESRIVSNMAEVMHLYSTVFFPEMTKTRYGFLEIWRLLDQSVTFCSSLLYFCFQRDSSFSDYTQHIVTSSSPNCTDCLCSDTVSHGQIFMDESWDNATLRCITRNTTYFIELSAETTISLGPSRMCRMFYGLDFIIRFTLSTNPYKC